jgi:hypothetical protein
MDSIVDIIDHPSRGNPSTKYQIYPSTPALSVCLSLSLYLADKTAKKTNLLIIGQHMHSYHKLLQLSLLKPTPQRSTSRRYLSQRQSQDAVLHPNPQVVLLLRDAPTMAGAESGGIIQ